VEALAAVLICALLGALVYAGTSAALGLSEVRLLLARLGVGR
jgi:hypothetical protein